MNRAELWERLWRGGMQDVEAERNQQELQEVCPEFADAISKVFGSAQASILGVVDWKLRTPVEVRIFEPLEDELDPTERSFTHLEVVDYLSGETLATFSEGDVQDFLTDYELQAWIDVRVDHFDLG